MKHVCTLFIGIIAGMYLPTLLKKNNSMKKIMKKINIE